MVGLKEKNESNFIKENIYSKKGKTWPEILKYNYENFPDRKAMRKKRFGIWEPYSWKDYFLNVKYLALGLLSLGFESGDKLLIIGDNSPEWYFAELACQTNHGISVGLDADLPSSELTYFVKNSQARFAIVQDQEQVDKFLSIIDLIPELKKIIYWNYKGLAHYNHSILIGYKEVKKLGEQYETKYPGLFEKNLESLKEEDICSIIYTAGTTELPPKGALHTFKSLRINAINQINNDSWFEKDNLLPYLPPIRMIDKLFLIGCHLLSACTLNFAEETGTIERDIKEICPDIVFYNARIWEHRASTIQAKILEGDVLKRFFFNKLMPIGYKMTGQKYKRQKPDILLKILYYLSNLILFNPIKKSLGLTRARICYSTDSMLSPEVFKFYHTLNLPLKSIYGTAEGGVLAGLKNDELNYNSVGNVYPGIEVRITSDGEIISNHEGTFSGYYMNSEKTLNVLRDGWFYSGDLGVLSDDGRLIVMDRLKDVVYLANGETLFPQSIECRLRFSPYIKDALVFTGPGRKYVSAIIVINYENISRWAGQRRISYTTFADLSQKEEIYEIVKKEIERVNQSLPEGLRIRKFIILYKEFNPDDKELTRIRTIRRGFLMEKYHELIKAIYNDKIEIPIEVPVKHRDGEMGSFRISLKIRSL